MPNTLILQELKRLILVKNKIRVISPSDCRIIAISIQKQLKKNISETTIKRLFGFASIKHEFSKFTINTLKEYVGMVDEANVSKASNLIPTTSEEQVDHQRLLAERITADTRQRIQNRCSVPYEMTIPREFARHDIAFFLESNYSYTAFIAHPGYGKSILLSHLVQQLFLDTQAPFKKDIVLFFTADQLFTKELDSLSLEDWIKAKLGLSKDIELVPYFTSQYQNYGMKLIVIIDGFSEMIITKESKPKILGAIIDFIARIGQNDSVKIIFSMRPTTWSRFNDRIKESYFFKQKWFPGNYFNLKDNSNVPPLTDTELERIFHLITPLDFTKISSNLKQQLKFPFHIQWYYQLREEYPAFESYTNIVYYEIIDRLIQEKIYNAAYASEKVVFCKKIIQLTNFGRKGYHVNKTDLMKDLSFFKNAYNELLANGILMEERLVNNAIPSEYIRFTQPHVFEYFLFIELYDVFNGKMNAYFFNVINKEYTGNQVRFQLLQWSVRLMIKQHKLNDLEAVLDLELNSYEKNFLIYFIAENLKYNSIHDTNLIPEIKAQDLHGLLIKKLIHFDFIDSCYKDAVSCLIEITDNEHHALLYHTILAIFDCLSMDQDRILKRLSNLEKLGAARSHWTVDPYEIVKIINFKLKGASLEDNPTLKYIEEFKQFKHHLADNNQLLPDIKQIMGFLLILMVNLFCGTPAEAVRIIAAIVKQYPQLKVKRSFFSIFILNVLALANARANPGPKTDQMENILEALYVDEKKHGITAYTQSSILSLKAEQHKNRKEYAKALKFAKECLSIYQRNQLVISELYTYKLIISLYQLLGEEEKARQYIDKKNRILAKMQTNLPMFN